MRESIGAGLSHVAERVSGISRRGVIFVADKTAGYTERILLPRIEDTLTLRTEVNFPPEFGEQYKQRLAEGYGTVVYANHMTQYDGLGILKVIRNLRGLYRDVLGKDINVQMIFAKTMQESQGEFIKRISAPVLQQLETEGIFPVPLVRPEELDKLRAKGDGEIERAEISNKHALRRLLVSVTRSGDMVLVFPEATVKGGRTKGKFTREVNGLQAAKQDTLYTMYRIFGKHVDGKVMFIPVGMFGGHHIFSANHKLPTLTGVRAVLGFGRADIVKVNVGLPIDAADIVRKLGYDLTEERFNELAMRELVPLLPTKAQGIYRLDGNAV